MKIYSQINKLNAGAVALIFAASSFVAIPSSYAADTPTVTLISPVVSGSNSINRTLEDLQIPAQKWYREGSRSIVITSPEGKDLTLKFLVTKDGKTPWVDQNLTILVGAPYSGSTGKWSSGGTEIGPQAGEYSETYAGLATAQTNTEGIATFTFTNKNSGSKFTSSDVLSGFFKFTGNKERLYTQFKPMISGLKDYEEPYLIKDIISVDIVKDSAPTSPTPTATPTPTAVIPTLLPTMRLVSPVFGPSNSVDTTNEIAQFYSAKTRAFYTYIAAGSTLTLKYQVTSDGTAPLANTEVTLQANSQYSGSKANWLSGATKIGAGSDSAPGAQLKGKTNAAGEVIFVIKNTDTTGVEAKPSSPTASAPKVGRLFGTFKPVIAGYGDKEADVDLATFDVYAAAQAKTITCVKGKQSKKITAISPKCPAGYKKK